MKQLVFKARLKKLGKDKYGLLIPNAFITARIVELEKEYILRLEVNK